MRWILGCVFNRSCRFVLWLWMPPERNLLQTPPRPDDGNMTGLGWRGGTLRARPAPPTSQQLDHVTVHENINLHPRSGQ